MALVLVSLSLATQVELGYEHGVATGRPCRGREPMARESDVDLLMAASGSLDINTIVSDETFCNFPTKPSVTPCSTRSRINSKKHVIKGKIQTFTIV